MQRTDRGRFVRDDVRPGMDVYSRDGTYLGAVRRVRLASDREGAGAPGEIGAIEVGSRWRPTRQRVIPVGWIQSVSMERVVLRDDARLGRSDRRGRN